MNPIDQALQMLFGGKTGGQTTGLPYYIKSPISQQTTVPHPQDFSSLQNVIGNAISPLEQKMQGFFQQPFVAQNPLQKQQSGAAINPRVLAAKISAPPTNSPTPSPIPGVSQMQALPTGIPGIASDTGKFFTDMMNNHILPVTRQYGIPDAVTAAQAAQESGYMQKPAGQYNFFGLKSNSHKGFASFDTPEQAALYYAQTITNNVPNFGQVKSNPLALLTAIQSQGRRNYEGDNPNPMQYVYDVSNNPVWQTYGGGQQMKANPHGWAK